MFQYYDSFLTYTNNKERFTVYYPTLWERDSDPVGYGFVDNPQVSLQRQGASCALMYGDVDEARIMATGNTSTTKPKLGNEYSFELKEFSEIILPFEKALSDEDRAAGYTNVKLLAVPHFPYASSLYGFLVTSGDRQPLVEACVEEVESILHGRSIDYPSAQLSSDSNGILSLQDRPSSFETYAHIPKKITLLFENSATGREESIAKSALSDLHDISNSFLSGGKLYFQEGKPTNPVIMSVDIFTGERKTIPLPYNGARPIHAFFVRDNILYYLRGEFCNDYLQKCKDMTLESYNLTSGVHEVLASNSTSREIVGFSASGDLVLRLIDGDGGCGWGSYESFSFSTKRLTDLGPYSYCEGDPDSKRDQFKDLVVGSERVNSLIVKDGVLFSPRTKSSYLNGSNIRINTAEYQPEE